MTPEETTAAPSGEELRGKLDSFLSGGRTIQSQADFSDDNMAALYSVAHGEYESGRLDHSRQLFGLLCTLDHMQAKHWMGLGASCEMQKDYSAAAAAYAVTTLLSGDDPTPRAHAADCYMALGMRDAAENGFRDAIAAAGDRAEYAGIKERAEARLEMLTSG